MNANIILVAICLLAAVIATSTPEFIFPTNGDLMVIDRKWNITWDKSAFPGVDDQAEFIFKFNSKEISDLLKDTDMAAKQRGQGCMPIQALQTGTEGSLPLDLTIPTGEIQKLVDSLKLPVEIDMRWVVNNVLANVDQIPEVQRNVTIEMYKCETVQTVLPVYSAWVIVSSAQQVFIGLLAVLLSVALLL